MHSDDPAVVGWTAAPLPDGDHYDPITGRRVVPWLIPPWYGMAARVEATPLAIASLMEEPVLPVVTTWRWTPDGFLPYTPWELP